MPELATPYQRWAWFALTILLVWVLSKDGCYEWPIY
jgi:hypothetical protein